VRDNREVGWRLAEFRTLDRFRTPHTFNPPLTFLEACVAVVGALTRIFLGSLLFAVFGAFIWTAWATNHDPWRRTALVLSLFITIFALLAGVLMGVQAAVNGTMRRLKGAGKSAIQ
jgi:ABC-type sulfate transport system permease component